MEELPRRLTYADFEQRWEAVRKRVFIDKPRPDYIFPFRHRSWELMPIPYYPTSLLGPLSWMDYEGDCGEYDEFEPLFATLRQRGTDRVILYPTLQFKRYVGEGERPEKPSDEEFSDPSKWEHTVFPYEVSSSRENIEKMRHADWNIENSHPSYFSAEGNWGLQTFDEEVSLLGGTPEFMAEVYRHAGGRDAIRQRFIEYDIGWAWALSHFTTWANPVPPDNYPYNDAPRKAFYDMIGWDMPTYTLD